MKRLLCWPILFAVAGTAPAQWSSDPTVNLSIADAVSDQVQPKIVATADGGCWISWFDGIAGGFDVRVQKLDVLGNELLAHNGVLVLNRGFSSTQDYGLDVDASGSALLAFRDDTGANVQITAAKVSPSGTLVWGTAGVQLTSTTQFVAAPKIAGTSDGGAVVAWTQDIDTRVRKLDSNGVALWGADVVLTPGAGSYSASDLHDTGTDAILSFVHQTGAFGSPRHILAQKFDSTGAVLWGASHVAVFDGGSLQFGNFPVFQPDGAGGAVFSWYDTATLGQLQCLVQHLDSSGTESYPHNGSATSTNATRQRVSPSATYRSSSGEVFAFWVELNSGQSMSGLYGQKFNSSGVRQWTNDGIELLALGSDSVGLVETISSGPGAYVFWKVDPGGGTGQLFGARIDGTGAFNFGPIDVASTASSKSRLKIARSAFGFAMGTWSDDRVDAGDVLVQNVNAGGFVGPPGTTYCTGKTSSIGCVPFVITSGNPSVTDTLAFSVTSLDHVTGQSGLLVYSFSKANLNFHGGKLCVKSPIVRTAAKAAKVVSSATCPAGSVGRLRRNFNATIASGTDPSLTVGQVVRAQWFQRDPSNTVGAFGDNLSNGVRFTINP